MRKQLTAEQTAKRDARRAQFKALWKQVANTPELERIEMSMKYGFRKLDGGEFSPCNSMLLALQCPTGSVFGGFRAWLKAGRSVRKGEHGSMVWVPIGRKATDATTGETATENDGEKPGFIAGTVFDIGQTEETELQPREVNGRNYGQDAENRTYAYDQQSELLAA